MFRVSWMVRSGKPSIVETRRICFRLVRTGRGFATSAVDGSR
ncbi:MAG TPA: hypothetical protein RMI62_33440 [Polyangiaceae bacterium LLY-WYZ-15_(1-7)]|nr:hypothetical protein [Polyangiaceae bacterium LLY-WYZ-15_(1-7)]HJL34043.1 hypothetical protein [Polyangiaceae bacterium LLY-WYZ-15_(1-7)]